MPRDLEHHSVQEHATRLIWWIQQNIDLSAGLVFHDAILEYYVEMIIEAGWQERSWNPVARQLDLICTGGKKPYEWVYTKTGQKRRRRIYPIPPIISGHSTTRTSVWRAA